MTELKLAYVGVNSQDLKAWRVFGNALGFAQCDESTEDLLLLQLDDHHHRFAIHRGQEDGVAYLGWEVGSEAKLDALIDALKSHGIEFQAGSQEECTLRRVKRLVEFRDPLGFRHELCIAPLLNSGPFLPSQAMAGGFVTGRQGLGHAVFIVPDAEAASRFFTDVLGFRPRDTSIAGVTIEFLGCNPRHHSLALFQLPIPPQLQHVMVQVEDLDDVGRALERIEVLGIPVTRSLGRHFEDRMVSFYIKSPSGFDFEYGWGAIEVLDDEQWFNARYETPSAWGHRSGFASMPGPEQIPG